MVPPGQTRRHTFVPKPAGTRWYPQPCRWPERTLTRSVYSGMYGSLIVEPARRPVPLRPGGAAGGRIRRRAHLNQHPATCARTAARQRARGHVRLGLSFNDKMLGHGEPVRVQCMGQRVLFRLLNASRTKNVTLALPGSSLHPDRALMEIRRLRSESRRHGLSRAGGTRRRDRGDEPAGGADPGRGQQSGTDRNMGLGVVVERYRRPRRPSPVVDPAQYALGLHHFSATPDQLPRRILRSIELEFEKIPVKATAATTAGRSTASPGPIPTRCSTTRGGASAIAS